MLRIGYVRLRNADLAGETSALKALGCQVVRAEEPAAADSDDDAVLESILASIGEGDQLVVARLDQLAPSGRGMLKVLERLEARGASLFVAEPQISSAGPDGRVLRAALRRWRPSSRRAPFAGAAPPRRTRSAPCSAPGSDRWRSPGASASRG